MRKVIVMAGGQGARLRPLTLTQPKPLVPVANRPVMAYILEWLRSHGFREVLVTLHYRADDVRRAFGDGRAMGLRIEYRVEEEPLGTAGSVKSAEDWIAGEPFLIASGDALTDVDLTALQRRHREIGAGLTLGLKRVSDPSQYGVVEVDERGRVVRFEEKPAPGKAFSNQANSGIYCVEPEALARVRFPRGRSCDWSRDVFPQFMAEGLPIGGHEMEGYWCDIGTIQEYRRGQRDALEGAVKVALPATEVRPGIWAGPDVRIAAGAVIRGPALLGAGCRIERDALILPGSILGDRTIVRVGACVWNATLGTACYVGQGAVVRDCILGEGARVGPDSSVSEGAVLGRGCCLTAAAHVDQGRRVEPDHVLAGAAGPVAAPAERPPRRRAIRLQRSMAAPAESHAWLPLQAGRISLIAVNHPKRS